MLSKVLKFHAQTAMMFDFDIFIGLVRNELDLKIAYVVLFYDDGRMEKSKELFIFEKREINFFAIHIQLNPRLTAALIGTRGSR